MGSSFLVFVAFGTGNARLFLAFCKIRYRRGPSGVRDAFSEALGAKNRLLVYGMDIRCKKQPPSVRNVLEFVKFQCYGVSLSQMVLYNSSFFI